MNQVRPVDGMNRRVLVVDDNEAIHADFRKILTPEPAASADLLAAEADLFGEAAPVEDRVEFELQTASQGQEGYELVKAAAAAGKPFAMAFVDMRMPPGWDGLETITRIWAEFPEIEMVVCTAFSDYSWEEMIRKLGRTDRLLIVKKPFDHIEVLQVASALTHKWNLQQQAVRMLTDLRDLVQQRTADLERAHDDLVKINRELVQARDAADAANRSKTVFLANVSHELRTPMTAILGFTEELQDRLGRQGALAAECEALETIRRNAQHMVAIVGDLLDVAKLEAGKLTVERIGCAPLHVLADVVDLLRPKASARRIALSVVYGNPVPVAIVSDPLRLRQILLNLLDNAVKFTESGSVSVVVDLVGGLQPLLQFAVVDTGVGMDAEVLERLFRPFEQADRSTTRRFGGTGLGLAISRQLAQLLGGDIVAASTPGAGSRFCVTVATGPLDGVARIGRPEEIGAGPMTPPDANGAADANGARVLLVEDGADNQLLVTRLLERAGCAVEVVANGRECLERMATSHEGFDVVLMDVQMPVMDGITATEELRKRGCTVPIVALTANAMATDREACLAAGCQAFLTKPIDRRQLVATVGRLAARRSNGTRG